MTTDTINSTHDSLIKDTDHLKQDVEKIVEDVKISAVAHVEAVKDKVSGTFDFTQTCFA